MRRGGRGLLAAADGLERWLAGVMTVVVIACAARYVTRHGVDAVLLGAAVLLLGYAAYARGRRSRRLTVGVLALVALWSVLAVVAPSFAWVAVPLAFAVLRAVPWPVSGGVVVTMAIVVAGAWWRIADRADPTLVVGPVGLACVAVAAYRALQREADERQAVVDELRATHARLAEAQRSAGALAERTRLSRDIHDSVGQGLSSIILLLDAAQRAWRTEPRRAEEHVVMAASSARHELDEVRRVVRDLAPPRFGDADALIVALEEALRLQVRPPVRSELRVEGEPRALTPAIADAVLKSARGALANAVEHGAPSAVVVTLTFHADQVVLDVHDDGRGFDPAATSSTSGRGTGLAGIDARARALRGTASVESVPGRGATISLHLPLEEEA